MTPDGKNHTLITQQRVIIQVFVQVRTRCLLGSHCSLFNLYNPTKFQLNKIRPYKDTTLDKSVMNGQKKSNLISHTPVLIIINETHKNEKEYGFPVLIQINLGLIDGEVKGFYF